MNLTDNIIELNRDVEPLILQGAATRTQFFKPIFEDKYKPLQFVHSSDVHARLDLWNRMVEYVNYYKDYINFIIHTGDYCGGDQHSYVDFFGEGIQCERPVYTCVGNHDTVAHQSEWKQNTKQSAYDLLFKPADLSGLTFLKCDFSMTYYKDFPESNIRLITLDLYYDIELQKEWLREVLEDARQKGLCVMTAMHEPTAEINDTFGVTFQTKNNYYALPTCRRPVVPYEPIIVDFMNNGGIFICNLAGHDHHDGFGLTDAGVLNTVVPCGTAWNGWCDGVRIPGTRTFDCFNVISVDTNLGLLKIARVGNNRDNFLRSQRSLCYDYTNKKVIFND